MSQQNFYEKYAQLAIDQQIKYGIPASITCSRWHWKAVMANPTWQQTTIIISV